MGSEVASAVLHQVELLTTLSSALCGAVIVLFVRVASREIEGSSGKQLLRGERWWIGALVASAMASAFGFLSLGALTDALPIWLQHQYTDDLLVEQSLENMKLIRVLMILHMTLIIAGIGCASIAAWKNADLVK